MKSIFTFTAPLVSTSLGSNNEELWRRSLELFDDHNYLESLYTLFDYINPLFRTKYGNTDGTEFNIPHGSIVVNITIKDGKLEILTPFLALPQKNRVPLLRQVASLNDDLILAQIILRDEKLNFHFSCPLAMVHPHKIYNVIYNITQNGDKYDDEFVTKFGASRIYEPRVTPYDAPTAARVFEVVQQSAEECLEAVKYFEGLRNFQHIWGSVSIFLYKILYTVNPQGQLLNDMEKARTYHFRDDISSADMASAGKAFVEKIKAMTCEQLAENLYSVETFISQKSNYTLGDAQDYFKQTAEGVRKSFDSDDYVSCALRTTFIFYEFFYKAIMPDDLNAFMVDALTRSSAQPFKEAAGILLEAIEDIMAGDIELETEDAVTPALPEGFDMAEYMKNVQNMMGGDMSEYLENAQKMMAQFMGGTKQE